MDKQAAGATDGGQVPMLVPATAIVPLCDIRTLPRRTNLPASGPDVTTALVRSLEFEACGVPLSEMTQELLAPQSVAPAMRVTVHLPVTVSPPSICARSRSAPPVIARAFLNSY